MSKRFFERLQFIVVLFLPIFCFPSLVFSVEKVSIGILANRGSEATLKRWQSLTDYLEKEIPSHTFQIKPLEFAAIFDAVAKKNIDFILVNSGIYVELEHTHGIRPIVTMRNRRQKGDTSLFSGMIISLKNREDIRSFDDLKGTRFIAVAPNSLGGWLMAKRELLKRGFDPEKDFAQVDFVGTHDEVVFGVLRGQADAGTVRSDTLENMAAEGLIDIAEFHTIHGKQDHYNCSIGEDSFPYPHSTDIYPEWPFSKLSTTSDDLSAKVAIALLKMAKNEKAAQQARIMGWDVARNYQPVHDLYRELRIGPYRTLKHIRLSDVWQRYRYVIIVFAVFLASLCVLLLILLDMRQRLLKVNQEKHLMAMHDSLTGLPNRTLLKDHMALAFGNAERSGNSVAVLLLDLDNFKQINDTLGHAKGDLILQQVTRRLCSVVRKGDTISRWGGDEFVLLLDNIKSEFVVASIAKKILKKLSEAPYDLDGNEVFSSGSIGISLFPQNGSDSDTLLKHADAAMYAAKTNGRSDYHFFSNELHQLAARRHHLENCLRNALYKKEFFLLYQPQVDLISQRIVGAEALVRWNAPGRGMVSPAEFIPVTEETGLIKPLGEWILRTACTQAVEWQRAGLGPLRIAVNLSAQQFKQPDLVPFIEGVLQDTGLEPCLLELEITESVLMEKVETATDMLLRLKKLGIQIAIDDFGTGYSSLCYLKNFPIDRIKIAQEFVRDITADANDMAIVSATIAIAESLGLKLIAEGVETIEHLEFLRRQGCQEMQGFYFSRPLKADQLATLCRQKANPSEEGYWGAVPLSAVI